MRIIGLAQIKPLEALNHSHVIRIFHKYHPESPYDFWDNKNYKDVIKSL